MEILKSDYTGFQLFPTSSKSFIVFSFCLSLGLVQTNIFAKMISYNQKEK